MSPWNSLDANQASSPIGRAAIRRKPMAEFKVKVNGQIHHVEASADTPLLYALANDLALHGPRFGCGLAQCGSCSVLLDGVEVRSCQTPIGSVGSQAVTTLEGLAAWYAERQKLATVPVLHPLQQAFIDVQAPQCGYCVNGMLIKDSELLSRNPRPTEAETRSAMDGHLCRCGTYPRVMQAIQLASRTIAGGTP
jgi:aerobic-type carbon monoxide dehydrogenase small subunit (CoxS/CutS family)